MRARSLPEGGRADQVYGSGPSAANAAQALARKPSEGRAFQEAFRESASGARSAERAASRRRAESIGGSEGRSQRDERSPRPEPQSKMYSIGSTAFPFTSTMY